MIVAEPDTDWLRDCLPLDSGGFGTTDGYVIDVAPAAAFKRRALRVAERRRWNRYRTIGSLQTASWPSSTGHRYCTQTKIVSMSSPDSFPADQRQTDLQSGSTPKVSVRSFRALADRISEPLAAIRFSVAAALRRAAREPGIHATLRADLEQIAASGEAVAEVIHRVRAAGDGAPLRLEAVEISELIETAVRLARSRFPVRTGDLLHSTIGRLIHVTVDSAQVVIALGELLANAIEASEGRKAGSRQVVIAATLTEDHEVLVSVADMGTGIAPRNAPYVFDAMYTTKLSHVGMGLALCRAIVEAHGGDIWFESMRGEGATFYLTLSADGPERAVQPRG